MLGLVTARLRVQPCIATLALMVLARGAAEYVSGGMKVSTAVRNADGTFNYVDASGLFRGIDTRILGGNVSMVTVIFAVWVVVAWFILSRLVWGVASTPPATMNKPRASRGCRSRRRRPARTWLRAFLRPWPDFARRRRSNRVIPRNALSGPSSLRRSASASDTPPLVKL